MEKSVKHKKTRKWGYPKRSKTIAHIQHNALLHPYVNWMCTSTTTIEKTQFTSLQLTGKNRKGSLYLFN